MENFGDHPADLETVLERFPDERVHVATLKEPKTTPPLLAPEVRDDGELIERVTGFYDYHGLNNADGNTCGQAAIAAVADRLGLNINVPRESNGHWNNDAAINRILADGHRPDVFFGKFGTSGGTIASALAAYGANNVTCGYVGVGGFMCQGGWSWEQCWASVQSWVNAGWPVPVLVDAHWVIPGQPVGSGHWPVMIDCGGGNVTLANCRSDGRPIVLAQDAFLTAWNYLLGSVCGYSHCFVVAQR